MAKDPAMLWYWGDWYSGTVLMSRFLKGCYMDLLHAQFNTGRLSIEEIRTCLGSDFGTSWPTIQKKFKQDETGLFFNERLEQEKEKRKAFSKSRKTNIEKRYLKSTYVDTSVVHMNLHMENENENSIELKKIDNPIGSTKVKEIARSVWTDQFWKESVCMGNHMKIDDLQIWMAKYNASIMNDTIPDFTESTYKKMFQGWVNKQKGNGVTVGDKMPVFQQNVMFKKL